MGCLLGGKRSLRWLHPPPGDDDLATLSTWIEGLLRNPVVSTAVVGAMTIGELRADLAALASTTR
jgi:hypothetical protein